MAIIWQIVHKKTRRERHCQCDMLSRTCRRSGWNDPGG